MIIQVFVWDPGLTDYVLVDELSKQFTELKIIPKLGEKINYNTDIFFVMSVEYYCGLPELRVLVCIK